MSFIDLDDSGELFFNLSDILNHFPKLDLAGIIEIILLTLAVYYIAKSLKNTRVWVLLKGLAIVLSFYIAAYMLNFAVIVFLFRSILLFIGIAMIVVIQPELRKLVEKIGTKNINNSVSNLIRSLFKNKKSKIIEENRISDKSVQEIVKGCFLMSKVKTGVLIVIEGAVPLTDIVASGIPINADITSALLINIFEKNTPLHDGAVVIRDDKIVAGTCYLPLSQNSKINKDLGTRHRAAIGVSEMSDAAVIVVSEETGSVSFIKNGTIKYNITREKLLEYLDRVKLKSLHLADKKQGIDKNIGLKAVSLIVTLITWFLVISSVNPITSVTFRNIPIEYINTDLITDTGKTFTVNSAEYINVTVRDRKDIVDSISLDDFSVIADFSKLSYVNSIPLEVKTTDYPNSEFKLNQSEINISMEDVISTEVEVEIEKIGETNDKYYVSNIDLSDSSVVISGAKSLINAVNRVVVTIDESKLTSDTTLELEPKIYDKNGSEISKDSISISVDKIYATISLYNTKEIGLNIKPIINEPIIRSIIKSIDCDTKSIIVAGQPEVLDKYDSIDIEIPIDIQISDIAKNEFIKNIILQDYAPNGLLITPQYSRVNLNILFDDFYIKNLEFKSTNIEAINIEDGLKYYIEDKSMQVDLISKSINLEIINDGQLKPLVDLSGLGVGQHDVKIQVKGLQPDQFDVLGDTVVRVSITQG